MATNKVIVNNEIKIDLTEDTVTPETLFEGVTAHDKSGNIIGGTFTIDEELDSQDNLIAEITEALAGKAAPVLPFSISKLEEGTIIKIKENGVLQDYYLAQHNYQPTLNGSGRVLFARKEGYGYHVWNSSANSTYANSTIDTFLNGDFKTLFDADVREAMGETSIPNAVGYGNSSVTTLQKSVFLLSVTELGKSHSKASVEGEAVPIADMLDILNVGGEATAQWTRTPYNGGTGDVWWISSVGTLTNYAVATGSYGIRPCFTLPNTATVLPEANLDGSYTLAISEPEALTFTASLKPLTGVTYTNGLDGLTTEQLNEICYGISYNSNIDNTTCEVYVDGDGIHRKISIGDQITLALDGTDYAFDVTSQQAYGTNTERWQAGMTLQMHDCYATTYKMNSTATNQGGWEFTLMRISTLSSLITKFSEEYQNVIKSVNKKTSAGSKSSTINTTEDKLFLLSEIEVFGSLTYSYAGEGEQYAYYKAGNSKIKKVNGSAQYWWERSPAASQTQHFCNVGTSGGGDYNNATNTFGVAFAICI